MGTMVAGDSSSPFSAESNFRELDDVFLQTRARIWLGEVLGTRLDENISMSDLLADGELLFELSGEVWRMLLTRYTELRHRKTYNHELFASRKSSKSYMPYSNVDSFLKICKILGLTGIDLFSPSDVVEKKNTRKVCMCIRSLSKKVRSKQLNVPDFDMVTRTVAMPTDNVGCIRRSLEQTQHSFLSNTTLNSDHDLVENLKKKNSIAAYNKMFDTCSEESVDESYCNSVIQLDVSSTTCSNGAPFQINSNIIDSPGVSSVVEKYATAHVCPSEKYPHHMESLSSNKSSGSSCLMLGEDDYQQDCFSTSSCVNSLIDLSGRISPAKALRHSNETGGVYSLDLYLENDVLEGSVSDSMEERGDVTNQPSVSGMIIQENGNKNPIRFDEIDSFSEYRSPSSHGSNSTPRTIENAFRSRLYDVNDVEVSPAAEIKPLPVILKLDFDDQLDVEHNIKVVSSPGFQDGRAYLMNNESPKTYNKLVHHPTSITENSAIVMEVDNVSSFTNPFLSCLDYHSCMADNLDDDVSVFERTCKSVESKVEYGEGKTSQKESNALKDVHSNQCLDLLSGQSYSLFDAHLWDQKGKCAVDSMTSDNYENNDHGISPHCVSLEGLDEENSFCSPANSAADSLLQDINSDGTNSDKEVLGATIFKSYQPNNHFQSELKSTVEDCAIQPDSDQNRHKLDTASKDQPLVHRDAICPPTRIEPIPDKNSCSTADCTEDVGCQSSQVSIDQKNDSCCARNLRETQTQGNQKHEEVDILAVDNSERTDDPTAATQKPYGRLLLNSAVRGTAVFGVLFLFLQLRKTGREGLNRKIGKMEENGVVLKRSREKQQKENRSITGAYPANKLVFGA